MSNDPIDTALRAEQDDLLRMIDAEPGYFRQLGTIFSGSTGWVNMMLMAAQVALFIAGVFAAVHFFEATDAHAAVMWGIPAALLLLMSLMIKLAMWPVIQANRVLRAIKLLEMRITELAERR